MSITDRAQVRESPPARDRLPNDWATPPTPEYSCIVFYMVY